MNLITLFLQIYRNIVYAKNHLPHSRKVIPAKAHPLPGSFKPHLTLARIKFLKNKKAFYQAVEMYRDTFMQTATTNELIFYQSILKPEGPEYKPLGVFALRGGHSKTSKTTPIGLPGGKSCLLN